MASAGVHALAGATGGMLAMTILYPLDNIRARLQVQEHKRGRAAAAAAAAAASGAGGGVAKDKAEQRESEAVSTSSASPAQQLANAQHSAAEGEYIYAGSWDCFQYVVTRLGWRNLYRGLKSAIVGMGVSSAVYFYWYQHFRNAVLSRTGRRGLGPLENVAVACAAGVVNVFLTTPFWVVNTRMTIQKAGKPEFNGVWDAFRKIAAENKFYGFYRGIVPSLILVSNPAIQFVTYEQLTRVALRRSGAKSLTAFEAFVLGAVAKALATVATYPYQVVKSRLQADRSAVQPSTFAKIRHMWAVEGWESFYAGMGAKLSQTVLTAALMFVLYEKILRIVQRFLSFLSPAAVPAVATAVAVAAGSK